MKRDSISVLHRVVSSLQGPGPVEVLRRIRKIKRNRKKANAVSK